MTIDKKYLSDSEIIRIFAHKSIGMKQLSIIIPVYNVEKYIHACLESVFRQGLDEECFEVIIVNDGTKDNSMEAIADILEQHQNIIVIEQSNQGLSVARNNGIAKATGEYLLMPDSDDLLVDNSVKPLLEKALETKADMVIADYRQMDDEEIAQYLGVTPSGQKPTFTEATGTDFLSASYCRYYWRSLYRKAFLTSNNISFIPGIYAQDVPFTDECFLKANSVLRTSAQLVVYRRGHSSASITYTLKRANDTTIAIKRLMELTALPSLSAPIREQNKSLAFSLLYEHICAIGYGHLKSFAEMVQVYDFLKEQIPEMPFKADRRQKAWSFLYNHLPTSLFALVPYTIQSIKKKLHKAS